MPGAPFKRTLCVFLLAMSVLSLEVALTRIFSFITFHHFTYLVISIAMLGFGAAGAHLTTQKPNLDSAGSEGFLAKNVGFLGLTIVAAVVLIPRIHFSPMDMYLHKDYGNLISFLLIVCLASAPFYFGGICIGYIISNAGKSVNQVYFDDLAGAATGCLLVLFLINHIGAIAA